MSNNADELIQGLTLLQNAAKAKNYNLSILICDGAIIVEMVNQEGFGLSNNQENLLRQQWHWWSQFGISWTYRAK